MIMELISHRKLILFYVREINYEDDLLDKLTYGEMRAKERPAYNLH
jgi:hypothetical protein